MIGCIKHFTERGIWTAGCLSRRKRERKRKGRERVDRIERGGEKKKCRVEMWVMG